MSKNLLLSYVEEYILNPALSHKPNIDDDGNEETVAVCDKKVEGKSPRESFASVSKLRQKNAQLLDEVDPRYRGKKASRKSINKEEEVSFDPELAKFCVIEEDNEDEDGDDSDDDDDNSEASEVEKEEIEISNTFNYNEKSFDTKSLEEDYMKMADDEDELSEEEENTDSEVDDEDDGNSDDMEDESNNYENSDSLKDLEEDNIEEPSTRIQTFSKNEGVEIPKGIAVKNQCSIYDKLFEARIGLQKVASIANQLPQFDKYKSFLENTHYPLYKEKLLVARKEIKKLLSEIIKLQGTISKNNQETAAIIESEERDTVENDDENVEQKEPRGNKRKLEEFEEILRKRHKNLLPFRDETLNRWHEKSKLLINQSKKSNFGKFEISPAVQIKNILVNKEELVKKTRLIGVARGNAYKILGKDTFKEESANVEEYDSEIYDDSDFYSRLLEDFLKSKISVSDNMTEVSMHWVGIQKLRKKSKKKVEANANKGRKLRYQVITKQQNFMAPGKYSVMSDEATNKLFSSLFGGSIK
ncbi:Protein AATF [Armadillidium nasatum]|uniref:Protein AATF n=1 Tax=Armadillidium nasatum TaxID=96803 RepID=A0A5N5TE78_9CRUS|nr:Protein AATF [Armadillidium nasatum]